MDPRLETNKKNVVAFYDLMFNQCQPRDAIERYAGDVYIQHNPLQTIPTQSANANSMF